MKINKFKSYLVIWGIIVLVAMGFGGNVRVFASSVTPTPTPTTEKYHFVFNSEHKADGSEYELKDSSINVYVNGSDNQIVADADIDWVSSKESVVKAVEDTSADHFAELQRKGPGYAMITAKITKNGVIYNISCQIKVTLDIDYGINKTPYTEVTQTAYKVTPIEKGVTQKIYLKYKDAVSIADNSSVTFTSDNDSVAKIADNGDVIAVGAGSATITIVTNTSSSSNDQQKTTFTVVVRPLALDPSTQTYKSDFTVTTGSSIGIINTNALKASNLKWQVYDNNNTLIDPAVTSKIKYEISTGNGSFIINRAKAGTYEIYAFANKDYDKNTSIPYIHIKYIVPVALEDTDIVMNVGDTYNITENSNIPSASMFNYAFVPSSSTIASINTSTGVITANTKGKVELKLTYLPAAGLFTDIPVIPTLTVTIIDGIALNYTAATIYTAGTMQLAAITTDSSEEIVWTTSDDKIATVKGGLVTGVSKGQAVITATQTVKGVVKSATCTITVQPSVTKITISPSTVTLNMEDFVTLKATVEPSGLNNVKLKWVSANENVVKITDSGDLTVTIQGGNTPGTTVITAINQDNVVVGSCHVTVKQKVTSITLSDTTVNATLSDKSFQLRAIVSPVAATNKEITWSSTNTKVATVDQDGLVTLIAAGSASIIATSKDNPTVTAICNVNVDVSATSLVLDETTKIMYVGESTRITYTITPSNASNKDVTWSSLNTSVVSVDSTGLLTAKGVGQAVIIVKSEDGTLMKTCTITVKQKATGVSFDVKDLELNVGQSYTIKTTMTPANSTEITLTWESTDTKVATVDQNGKVTGVATGKAVIIAKTSIGGSVYCNVTVVQQVTGLQLNFEDKTIVTGESFQIKATILPSEAIPVNVTWTSSNKAVASVSANGVVKGLTSGAAVITCKTADGEYTAICVVEVIERVTKIKLNKSSYKLGLGKSFTIDATVETNAATNPKIKWSTSNKKIATVNSKGKVTGKTLGYVTITATAQDGSRVDASCDIRVVKLVTSISLNRTSVNTIEGRSFALKASINPSNASYKQAKWSSSDETVAIVESNGVVTALKEGKVIITASAQDSSGKSARCYVNVQALTPATSVTILNQNLTMVVGETNTLQMAINPIASTDQFSWESDNKTVATVSKSLGKVTARTPGIANVTVMTDSGKTATTKVTVVGLNTTKLVLEQYSKYQLEVIGITSGITWDVADSEIAVVTGGRVESRRTGTTTITATVNGRRLTCKLQVVSIK